MSTKASALEGLGIKKHLMRLAIFLILALMCRKFEKPKPSLHS